MLKTPENDHKRANAWPLQLLCGTALALLPHLHGLDRHPALVTLAPSREPLLCGIVESPSGVGSIVQPRLVADLVPVHR